MANATFKVSEDTMKKEASEISAQITKIQTNWSSLSGVIERTKGYWEGEASNLHGKMFSDIKKDMEKLIKKLNEHPEDLYKMAGVYEEAEKKAAQLANALPTNVIQ